VEAEQVEIKEKKEDGEAEAEEQGRNKEKPELPAGCSGGQAAEIL
jgi:hypothetical protein